jgi:hypothetical protein
MYVCPLVSKSDQYPAGLGHGYACHSLAACYVCNWWVYILLVCRWGIVTRQPSTLDTEYDMDIYLCWLVSWGISPMVIVCKVYYTLHSFRIPRGSCPFCLAPQQGILLCELWLGLLAPCGAKGSLVVNGYSLPLMAANCTSVDIWGSTLFPPQNKCQFILYLAWFGTTSLMWIYGWSNLWSTATILNGM